MVRGDVRLDGVNLATITTGADGKDFIQDRRSDEEGKAFFHSKPSWLARNPDLGDAAELAEGVLDIGVRNTLMRTKEKHHREGHAQGS